MNGCLPGQAASRVTGRRGSYVLEDSTERVNVRRNIRFAADPALGSKILQGRHPGRLVAESINRDPQSGGIVAEQDVHNPQTSVNSPRDMRLRQRLANLHGNRVRLRYAKLAAL